MARRVERSLLSYERSGWLEDSTVVTKHSEIRPSSEMGPIICCLDTSGSMHGARETVAKVGHLSCVAEAPEEPPCTYALHDQNTACTDELISNTRSG